MVRSPADGPTLADMLRYTPAEWKAEQARKAARLPPIALPADPNDPEDFDVSEAGVEAALAMRRSRRLVR